MTAGYSEFEFDLPEALLARLVVAFDSMTAAPLVSPFVDHIPEEQGVYQLFLQGSSSPELVYIGKTDAGAGLGVRLKRHAGKIQHRLNLDPQRVLFKAVRIYVFTAVDLETQLIGHYGGKVRWNGSGFGSNDPGEKRDTTYYKADHFDTQYPIDIRQPLGFAIPSNSSAADVLRLLKKSLPYLIRYERASKGRAAHADLESTQVTIKTPIPQTPESVIVDVVRSLPVGWHATLLPSHIIIYKNDTRKFPSGKQIVTS